MTTENTIFFATEANQKTLKQFLSKLTRIEDGENKGKNIIISHLRLIITSMINNASEYDENCQSNIGWIGNNFLSSLQEFNEKNEDAIWLQIASIFTTAYRFLCELEFSIPNDLNHDLRRIKQTVDDNLSLFDDLEKSQIVYANLVMPAQIAKRLIKHKNVQDIDLFNQRYDSAISMKKIWDGELDLKTKEINALKNKLEEYKTGFNFVGLYKGFDNLSVAKNTEKNWALFFLIGLGMFAILPVATEIYLFLFKTSLIKNNINIVLYSIFPMITVQIILVYFFRVALANFKSIKAQLLQIELRKTLCQFIQSYTSYAKEMKESNNSSLEKFESLIFSGLISNEENLPSTFDGLEQIGKIIQSLKTS